MSAILETRVDQKSKDFQANTRRMIDLLTEISGMSFDEVWATREATELEGSVIPFIGRDAFVRNKLASGRPKDLVDARRLKPPSR